MTDDIRDIADFIRAHRAGETAPAPEGLRAALEDGEVLGLLASELGVTEDEMQEIAEELHDVLVTGSELSRRNDVKMTKTRLTGYDAITYAEERDMLLGEGAREDLSPDEAREIAAKDPSLIYLDIQPSVLTAEIDDDAIRVRDSHGGVWYPDDEAEAEIRAASDPGARAVEVARTTPMRGTWHD